jgi:hypothetical protein
MTNCKVLAFGIPLGFAAVLFLGSCAAVTPITSTVVRLTDRDLARTVELAQKYGKDEVAQCAAFLRMAIEGNSALANEDVDGVISLALKLYLLQEQRPIAEKNFKDNCQVVAGGLVLEIAKQLKK